MSTEELQVQIPLTPNTAGVGARRKHAPKLPLSAFSPPGTSSGFPLPTPDPSLMLPASIIDAGVSGIRTWEDLNSWWTQAADRADRTKGIVVQAPTLEAAEALDELYPGHMQNHAYAATMQKVLCISVPMDLSKEFTLPERLHKTEIHLAISSPFTSASETYAKGLQAVLEGAYVAEIDVHADLGEDKTWEELEDILGKALPSEEQKRKPVILKNLLIPAVGFNTPLVKLLTHPVYKAFQDHITQLSLFPSVYVQFGPPEWGPVPAEKGDEEVQKERREWKRRIKMYLGPVVEAFGFSRIIYSSTGSSKSPVSKASDWYTLARECVAEMGVEQDALDGVFGVNALDVYKA
ncbi:hypothetical protein DACRYDRAFT_20886 [Dacryopinax primogenitus]|uniref:Amidohydrolase-related domain-containing protein n=1 Tax=Dacryopinax primogenitus (strain DJM 731) TaxID=1858805 RepID=M5GFQ2_DACPD|nr:uncharacterized protein DACRYDRAFT_20886 [Dacryopinax primogenitus]EJU04318.1 hypothetical protein DACRYDRAFT_20886 [Dacryopinax primogenitus]